MIEIIIAILLIIILWIIDICEKTRIYKKEKELKCPECGSYNLEYKPSCILTGFEEVYKCLDCGWYHDFNA